MFFFFNFPFFKAKTKSHLAAGRQLPWNGVHAELSQSRRVNNGQKSQIDSHEKIGHSEIANQESGHVNF